MEKYRDLTEKEIDTLIANNCTAENWNLVQVTENFDASRIAFTHFSGHVVLGDFSGHLQVDGVPRACGIYHARIHNCQIKDNVLIHSIGSAISNYLIASDVLIENTFLLQAEPDATFGNGVQVSVLNEAGGREVTLFSDLNAQVAYMQALFRHDSDFQDKLQQLIQRSVAKRPQGAVASGARIRNCGQIKNVNIGEQATLQGVSELVNGTILSCTKHPTFIGAGVLAHNFIISEGASIDSNATLENVFIGQAAQIGKQFSAENALFFANCEGFNGEVNSIFAGPYSVTHHKATLLIASLFSFFNAGSGSNQSNHMYKLGPIHQGIFERGCKTGSFSYVLLESHIPAFSTIIGKHLTNINAPILPFSYITEEHGESRLMPGINLFSTGTVRDEVKWPARDRRKAENKRDLIIFDVFSPYTIEKMRRGRAELLKLYAETPREKSAINYGGLQISRLMLRKGAKYYSFAVDRYLIGKVIDRVENAAAGSSDWQTVLAQLKANTPLSAPNHWLDLSGLLAAKEHIDAIINDVKAGKIAEVQELLARLKAVHAAYRDDEWAYVCWAFEQDYGVSPANLSKEELEKLIEKWENAAYSLLSLQLDDASKEFGNFSRIGYGLDLSEEEKTKDFEAVRGNIETNSVIQKLATEKEGIHERAFRVKEVLLNLS